MNLYILTRIFQVIISVLLIILILLQPKGKGLAQDIGNAFSMYRSRRGVEKVIFILTIVLALLLVANSLAIVLLS